MRTLHPLKLALSLMSLMSLMSLTAPFSAYSYTQEGHVRSNFGPRLRFVNDVKAMSVRRALRPLNETLSDLNAQFEYLRGTLGAEEKQFSDLEALAKSDPGNPRRLFVANLRNAIRHFELAVAAIPRDRKPGDTDFETAIDTALDLYRKIQFKVFSYRDLFERITGVKAERSTETEDRFARARDELIHADHGRAEYLASDAAKQPARDAASKDLLTQFKTWQKELRKKRAAKYRRGTGLLDKTMLDLKAQKKFLFQGGKVPASFEAMTPSSRASLYLANLVTALRTLDQEIRELPRRSDAKSTAASGATRDFYLELKPLVRAIAHIELKDELTALKARELTAFYDEIGNRLGRRTSKTQ